MLAVLAPRQLHPLAVCHRAEARPQPRAKKRSEQCCKNDGAATTTTTTTTGEWQQQQKRSSSSSAKISIANRDKNSRRDISPSPRETNAALRANLSATFTSRVRVLAQCPYCCCRFRCLGHYFTFTVARGVEARECVTMILRFHGDYNVVVAARPKAPNVVIVCST